MKRVFILFVSSTLALYSCQSETKPKEEAATEEVAQEETMESPEGSYGANVNVEEAITVEELNSRLADKNEIKDVVVKGELSEVCQKMGCWVRLKNDGGEDIFVKFRDHEFFVPKNATGREAIIAGNITRDVTPVDELKHYAEDAGESQETIDAITEPKEELQFDAAGIVIQ